MDIIGRQPDDVSAEQRLAGLFRIFEGGLAMHHLRHFHGERLLGSAGFRMILRFRFKSFDRLFIKEGEELQVIDHVTVVGIEPELIELVRRGPLGIKPHGTAGSLAELGTVGFLD